MRAPMSRSRTRNRRWGGSWLALQALVVLSLLIGLIAPLASLAAAQSNGPLPPPLLAPFQVSLSGSFQTGLGCPADFDPACPETQLQDNRDGSWSVVLPVPPGDYAFRVVAASDAGSLALGEGGDPNGADLFLSVPGDAAGAYFAYDSLTGAVTAEPVTSRVTLVTDLGEQFAMAPQRRGGYQVTWDAQDGNYGFQIQVNEEPAAQDSVSLDGPRRVIVAVDESGAVTAKDTLRGTTLDVTAVDAAGAPRPGSCFAIIDREERLRSQVCDADDGQLDGLVSLRVPNGLDDGNYVLRETQTTQGPPSEDQKIALGPGRAEATAASAGTAPEQPADEPPTEEPAGEVPPAEEPAATAPGETVVEPGDQPGRLTVLAVDSAGQPLPNACFAIVEFGFELCDDDGDGATVFDAVPAMPVTLRQTAPPPGFAPVADLTVSVEVGGNRVRVAHAPAGGEPVETPIEQPVETPAAPAETGQVGLSLRDRDGNPVSGGCWAVSGDGGNAEVCDGDDGADDGRIVFADLPAGQYRLDEVTTPPGFQPAGGQDIDVIAGAPAEFLVEYRPAEGEPGRLVILVADERGDPVGETCFDLRGPIELTEICDRQNDGRLNIPDLPAGDYTVVQTRTAGGLVPAAETAVTIPAGETVELPLVNQPEGTDQGQEIPPDLGRVVITIQSEDGQAIADVCFTLTSEEGEISVCDNREPDTDGDQGRIELSDVAPGDYTLAVQPPAGFTAPDPSSLQVIAGETARAEIVLRPDAVVTPEAPQTGLLSIVAEDDAGARLPGGCYTLDIGGQSFGPFCDDDVDGLVMIQGITPGPVVVTETTPPTSARAADPAQQEVAVAAGEEAQVAFRPQAAAENGTVVVRVRDAAGEPVAACVDLTADAGTFSVCDNREQDENADLGLFRIRGVPAGTYTVGLSGLASGLPAAEPQQIEVVAGESAEVEFTLAGGPGTLVIFVEDEQGDRIGGSCFTIQSETTLLEDVCDQGDDGRLNVPDLPAGDYTVTQTRAQGERELAPAQTVTVAAGERIEITLANPRPREEEPTATPEPDATATPAPEATATPEPEQESEQPAVTGALTVINRGPDGNRIGGGCFSIANAANEPVAERCDNERGDFDNTPGVLAFGGLPEGAYTITQTRAPEGFTAAAPLAFELGADGQTVEVVSESAAPETGTVEFATFDETGNPVTGQCYTLAGSAGTFGPFCDNGEGDTTTEPGVLAVAGLPTGTYEAVLEIAPASPDAELAQTVRQRRSVSVRRGDRPTRVQFNVRAQQNQRGDLLVRVRDDNGDYLADACFGLIPDGETRPTIEVCDNSRDDQNSSDGRILIAGLRAGRYTLTQTTAPDGFTAAADQSVRIAAGDVREAAVVNRAERQRTATLTIETIDRDGNPLPGACYAILRGTATTEACDTDNGDDGYTEFTRVESGSYVVRQIQAPRGGFAIADETAIRIDPGQSATVTVTNERRPGSLQIRKTDQNAQLLGGACFALRSGDRAVYTVCDNDASDGNRDNGIILLGTVLPGTYILRETQSPSGFLAVADQEIRIAANQRAHVTIANAPAPVPARIGDLRIFKIDSQGRSLAGSCFALIDSGGQVLSPTCDADDGADDGAILIEDIAVGTYTLRETRRPSADYETVADVAVQIQENRTVDVEVENRLRPGRILIRKSDPNGSPLQDACFDLVEDSAGAFCTDADGQLLFSDLAPGVYRVVETEAPPGFLVGPALDPVTVRPGSTAAIDVVDQPAPPPPDSGSIQVVKFLCPVAAGGAGIVFVDSSDPDGGGLARTAGCTLGDAAFALDGPSGPLEFRTGATGRFQTALATGGYVLTELATGAAEELVITVNTLTTVVVVNYVEPEPAQPAAVDVIKYTCAAGFQGRLWFDFADGCVAVENLTNNVGFRLSGPLSARRVTGDTGVGGATRFAGLPPGEYRLREEPPVGTVAVYAFCGLDPDAPDGRAVGTALTLLLSAGQNVTCHWFNVPEDLTTTTGALTVYKYACPITAPLAGFDWYGRCDPQGQGVRFSLSLWNGAAFVPVTTVATDADGILRLTRLQPGLYDLKEVDASWCHAESDSVNAQGNVVIEAGQRASVWIFNCVGPKQPPNTGAGPMWTPPGAAAGAVLPAAALPLGWLWPLLGFGVLPATRRIHRLNWLGWTQPGSNGERLPGEQRARRASPLPRPRS